MDSTTEMFADMAESIQNWFDHDFDTTDDSIVECGQPALALLNSNPDQCLKLAYEKLNDAPYKDVPESYRRLYTDAALMKAKSFLTAESIATSATTMHKTDPKGKNRVKDDEYLPEKELEVLTEVINILDKALILTGAPRRRDAIFSILDIIETFLEYEIENRELRPTKRTKLAEGALVDLEESFSTNFTQPRLRFPIPKVHKMAFFDFEKMIQQAPKPMIITGGMEHWPALGERPWKDPKYLLRKTIGGRRLVPVEIGKSYTSTSWGQKLCSFKEFMDTHMLHKHGKPTETGYLAQHDLLTQVRSLREDIAVPDYVHASPTAVSPDSTPDRESYDYPLINSWFGPADTISPLHTDPYHNIFAQVVGHKYFRLYAPSQTPAVHPRGLENGIDMSNTSSIDIEETMKMFGEISAFPEEVMERSAALVEEGKKEMEREFPGFLEAEYVEGVVGPGDMLYIPQGWWHFVRGLTPSFSVSFWWK